MFVSIFTDFGAFLTYVAMKRRSILTFFAMLTVIIAGVGGNSHLLHAQDSGSDVDQQSIEDALDAIRASDYQTGRAILEALSQQGNPDAFYHLAEMSRLGIGGETSMSIAVMYYRLAGKLGSEKAAMKLANILYFDGEKTDAEVAEAFATWQTYALTGNAEAAYLLGIIYWNGENGRAPDPVRGYGLVWKAAQAGYELAVNAELEMRSLLPGDARTAGQAYGQQLAELGFSDEHLNIELLVEGWTPDNDEDEIAEKPEDWSAVWHLEVGFAMREPDAAAMLEEIQKEHGDLIKGLHSEMVESANRTGRYKLVFGPIDGMHSAVRMCVDMKRAGYDCFAKPPGGGN